MQLNIKRLILEGYSYDEITEAVHANHPDFNKKTALSIDRNKLKDRIIEARRDSRFMKTLGDIKHSNYLDNKARAISQDPYNAFPVAQSREAQKFNKHPESQNYSAYAEPFENKPRVISSAKK